MKKLYFLLVAMLVSISANAAWYISGNALGWLHVNAKYELKEENAGSGIYKITLNENLYGEFLLVPNKADGTPDWDNQLASNGSVLKAGETYTLGTGKGNIQVEGTIKNPTVTFDSNNKTLLVEGKTEEFVEEWYVFGNTKKGDGNWHETKLTEDNGVWSISNLVIDNTEAKFLIKSKSGKYYGTNPETTVSATTTLNLTENDKKDINIAAGTYNFDFTVATSTLVITKVGGEQGGENPGPGPDPTVTTYTVYFDNTNTNWSAVYAYVWNGGDEVKAWGETPAMTSLGNNIYKYEFDWDKTPTNIIFKDSEQTVDLDFTNGHLYTATEKNSDNKWLATSSEYTEQGGEDPNPDPVIKNVYFVGAQTKWLDNKIPFETTDGKTYTLELEDGISGEWKVCDGTWGWNFGAGADQPELGKKTNVYFNSPANFTLTTTAKTYITFILVAGSDVKDTSIASEIYVSLTSGVESIAVDANAAPVFYNLQGVRVNEPANGLYIKVEGNKVSKVLVK